MDSDYPNVISFECGWCPPRERLSIFEIIFKKNKLDIKQKQSIVKKSEKKKTMLLWKVWRSFCAKILNLFSFIKFSHLEFASFSERYDKITIQGQVCIQQKYFIYTNSASQLTAFY